VLGLGVVLVLPHSISAQEGKVEVTGTVIRTEKIGVPDVQVTLSKWAGSDYDASFKKQLAKTDAKGGFTFKNLQTGEYILMTEAKFKNQSESPCKSTGMMARSVTDWQVLRGDTTDGSVLLIVTSKPITLGDSKPNAVTIDLRCK
jgi:hypothetical protein